MIKICPKCKKVVPVDKISCPNCGNKDLLLACSKCKKILPKGATMCPTCDKKEYLVTNTVNKKTPSSFIKKAIPAILLLSIIIGAVFIYKNVLWGNDKIAYDLIVIHANNFKDPSSIKVLSGVAGKINGTEGLEKYAFLRISAKNGFGGVTTSSYNISENDMSDLEDEQEFWGEIHGELANTMTDMNDLFIRRSRVEDELNVKKINKALQWKLG